jgi:hypothetical protein
LVIFLMLRTALRRFTIARALAMTSVSRNYATKILPEAFINPPIPQPGKGP